MSDADGVIASVLGQVVELDSSSDRAVQLGTAVRQHVEDRPASPLREPDPDVLASLRPSPNLALATTDELLDELRARYYGGQRP